MTQRAGNASRWVLLLAGLLAIGAAGCLTPAAIGQACAAFAGQTAARTQSSDGIDRPTSTPYSGSLSIFEDEDRAEKLQVERVMDLLGIAEGKRVADIGAGSGWFTVRAARRVGSSGVVYAVDINAEYVKHIGERARNEELPQIRTILGKENDPLLPGASVDAVLILKTYHEFAEPIPIMRRVHAALRPGGLVGIIDRDGDGDDHGVASKSVVEELDRAGFTLVGQHDFVKGDRMDYFLIFKAK